MKLTSLALSCAALTFCAASIPSVPAIAQLSSNAKVYASGLAGPRGLKFGPDGDLYVAEAGSGGTTSTKGKCTQVIPPIGPYVNGLTSRISKIDKSGKRTTVASGFPSSQSADATKDTSGVADLAFLDGELYAVTGGGGCSHGAATPNGIFKVDTASGRWKLVADLGSYLASHQAMYEDEADFEPDGTFYSLIAHDGLLYTVEPNHGQVFSVTPGGEIKQVIDISKAQGHIVPTSIAERDGYFFVANLGQFPIVPDSAKILTLSHQCDELTHPGFDLFCWEPNTLEVAGARAGFATAVAIQVGPDGLLYVLELSPAVGYPTPGLGKVVRLNANGEIEDIATGLSVPTGMTFGPDGFLYVSNWGAAPAGLGQIVRIRLP